MKSFNAFRYNKTMYKKYNNFIKLILSYNKIHKITGAKTKEEVLWHIKDSLAPFEQIELKDIKKVLDIGSGAGFPALVLAIEYPDIEFFLVEPLQKRVAFLYLIKSTYNLQNVTIISKRVEELDSFKVDLITSRAVTKVGDLLKLAKNFLYEGVELLLYKGENVYQELKKANIKNYNIIDKNDRIYLRIKL